MSSEQQIDRGGGCKMQVSGTILEKDSFQLPGGGDVLYYVTLAWLGGEHKQYVKKMDFDRLPQLGEQLAINGEGQPTDDGKAFKMRRVSFVAASAAAGDIVGRRRATA